ncbi:MAG: SPOR domain-containing protein [Bacteroidota bacterium]|uniref:SPOR domain-containing protein n=1 Tax=Flagellimonas okinawensis TaxID=3031324 RepID=A0ABT5XNN9_9FLAO|nr:SPOR domain-containing protein [[Muricauda] okinawensis]MDF0707513.1 SPOR domain-containing protein [[Muricauda] okinawensis]MEC8832077.1 SPOR domain-containing protein [Bacteroidota bacterium]
MKTTVFTAILIGLASQISAQEGQVSIQQDPQINQLVKLYTNVHANSGYYQIQVGFGNYEKAQDLLNQVEIDFPDWYSKIEFESPTYRVRLGKFKTKLEAERKYLEVRKKYPDAMLLKPEQRETKS